MKTCLYVIHNATERIGMEEKAAQAVRKKHDSSMRVGLKLVHAGKVAGFVTAGNTGAAMATAKMVLGTMPGVDRPALATPMPSSTGNPCVLLDVGANVDCKPKNLEQFAVMGEIYARTVLKIKEPRVGLLSIGEEESKGNDLTHEAFPLLKALPIKFIGNVEGRDIFSGLADVIVCDGFVGNVALKTSEGVGRFVRDVLRESLTRTVTAQVGALLSRKAFNEFRHRLDYREYGGAPLLGVRGVCIIGHGSSNDRAIFNGIRVAYEFAVAVTIARIEQEVRRRCETCARYRRPARTRLLIRGPIPMRQCNSDVRETKHACSAEFCGAQSAGLSSLPKLQLSVDEQRLVWRNVRARPTQLWVGFRF